MFIALESGISMTVQQERIATLETELDQLRAAVNESKIVEQATGAISWQEDFHDPQTALAIVNDAEKAGLVVQPTEFAYHSHHTLRVQIPWHFREWDKFANDSYGRGGRPAVVRDCAQAMRDVIKDGFPDGANRVTLYIS